MLKFIVATVQSSGDQFHANHPMVEIWSHVKTVPVAMTQYTWDAKRIAICLAADFSAQPTGDIVEVVVMNSDTGLIWYRAEVTKPKPTPTAIGLVNENDPLVPKDLGLDPYDGVPADTDINWDRRCDTSPENPPADLAADKF